MLTDWVLISRLAMELRDRIAGARVEEAGLLADGRTGIVLRKSGRRQILAIDLFASPPMLTLESGELGVAEEPGFIRVLARSLRSTVVIEVSARRLDRLLRVRFGSRSRFGVGDEFDLYVELVPRFGNAVLVKGATIVAAYKEFSAAENARRSIVAGSPYELPPLPERSRVLAPAAPPDGGEAHDEPLHLYRRDGALVQAYVVPLAELDDARHERAASLLDVFAELRTQQLALATSERTERRRNALLKRLAHRERKLLDERLALDAKRRAAARREELRAAGEAIYAELHTVEEPAREAAKERAVELFAEYRKLGKSLPHVAVRERAVTAALEVVETLRWETERAGSDDLDDVDAAVSQLEPRRRTAGAPARKRKRRILELRTGSGSRIVVGRSPIENAEVTFHLARPNDLWFHAQGTPGAHVILARDDRTQAPDGDLATAASLAAFYSKAQRSAAVPVDYTLRKHVRKQRDAPPGLVWYTHARTLMAQPKPLDEVEVR
jgi:predicted ribosome quality control (RQC) complex YloA/Tae2 family protein